MWKSWRNPPQVLRETSTNKTFLQQNITCRVSNIKKRGCFGILLKKLLTRKGSISYFWLTVPEKPFFIFFDSYILYIPRFLPEVDVLNRIDPMFHFWSHWKYQKTLWFSYTFRMSKNGTFAQNCCHSWFSKILLLLTWDGILLS